MATPTYSTRRSLRELDNYLDEKNNFLKAWKLIKALPPSNPNSFWSIATYHGEPFKDRRVWVEIGTKKVWGGYCQHGNVLFPSWHRFYCLRLEQALQTVVPDGNVALHYWDQTSQKSLENGLPPILTDEKVLIDGVEEENPLLNFVLPLPIDAADTSYYKKDAGYTTMRYPFSGITNPEDARQLSAAHNDKITSDENTTPLEYLQTNVKYWLNIGRFPVPPEQNSIYIEYEECLKEPDFNKFSNTSSAQVPGSATAWSLEQPHNDIHLAIGGYTLPDIDENGNVIVDENGNVVYSYAGLEKGANGDMGANEVASFDPVFFLHHANVDRMFWVWQKKHGCTTVDNSFTIYEETKSEVDPENDVLGTSTEAQGPSPNQATNQVLGMNTILYPYQDSLGVPVTTNECIDIESQLGYTYTVGSLDQDSWPELCRVETVSKKENNLANVLEDIKSLLLEKKDRGTLLRMFFDLTDVVDPKLKWDSLPVFKKEKSVMVDNKRFQRNYILQVHNLDKDKYEGSFVVYLYYKKKNGKLSFIGQRGILDRWERQRCVNCKKHRYAGVAFNMDGLDDSHPWNPDNIHLEIRSKNPSSGEMKRKIVKATAKDGVEEQVKFITRFQEINGQ